MIHTELLHPADLSAHEWRQLQTVAREAFGGQLNRTPAEIDHLVEWADPDRFRTSHTDPNSEVGRKFNANQSFSNPMVAVTRDGHDFVGFSYAADNVSGDSRMKRAIKMMMPAHKYVWLRETAIRPDFQRRHLAKEHALRLIMGHSPLQPVATYIWPDEIPFLPATLRKAKFEPTGEEPVQLFGNESAPVRQVRMQAPMAGRLAVQLARELDSSKRA